MSSSCWTLFQNGKSPHARKSWPARNRDTLSSRAHRLLRRLKDSACPCRPPLRPPSSPPTPFSPPGPPLALDSDCAEALGLVGFGDCDGRLERVWELPVPCHCPYYRAAPSVGCPPAWSPTEPSQPALLRLQVVRMPWWRLGGGERHGVLFKCTPQLGRPDEWHGFRPALSER